VTSSLSGRPKLSLPLPRRYGRFLSASLMYLKISSARTSLPRLVRSGRIRLMTAGGRKTSDVSELDLTVVSYLWLRLLTDT
jgi:hypothetical protein